MVAPAVQRAYLVPGIRAETRSEHTGPQHLLWVLGEWPLQKSNQGQRGNQWNENPKSELGFGLGLWSWDIQAGPSSNQRKAHSQQVLWLTWKQANTEKTQLGWAFSRFRKLCHPWRDATSSSLWGTLPWPSQLAPGGPGLWLLYSFSISDCCLFCARPCAGCRGQRGITVPTFREFSLWQKKHVFINKSLWQGKKDTEESETCPQGVHSLAEAYRAYLTQTTVIQGSLW